MERTGRVAHPGGNEHRTGEMLVENVGVATIEPGDTLLAAGLPMPYSCTVGPAASAWPGCALGTSR